MSARSTSSFRRPLWDCVSFAARQLQRAPECRSQADIVKGKAFSATVQTQDHRKFTVGLGSSSNCALIISCSRYHFLPKSTYFDVFLGCSCCAFRCKKTYFQALEACLVTCAGNRHQSHGPQLRRGLRLLAPVRKRPSLG